VIVEVFVIVNWASAFLRIIGKNSNKKISFFILFIVSKVLELTIFDKYQRINSLFIVLNPPRRDG